MGNYIGLSSRETKEEEKVSEEEVGEKNEDENINEQVKATITPKSSEQLYHLNLTVLPYFSLLPKELRVELTFYMSENKLLKSKVKMDSTVSTQVLIWLINLYKSFREEYLSTKEIPQLAEIRKNFNLTDPELQLTMPEIVSLNTKLYKIYSDMNKDVKDYIKYVINKKNISDILDLYVKKDWEKALNNYLRLHPVSIEEKKYLIVRATEANNLNLVKYARENFNNTNDYGLNLAFKNALETKKIDIVQYLLDSGVKYIYTNGRYLFNSKYRRDERDTYEKIFGVIEEHLSDDDYLDFLYAQLNYAVEVNDIDMLQSATDKLSSVEDYPNYEGVLRSSIRDKKFSIAKLLIEVGADIDMNDGELLADALETFNENVIKFLLDNGVNLNEKKVQKILNSLGSHNRNYYSTKFPQLTTVKTTGKTTIKRATRKTTKRTI